MTTSLLEQSLATVSGDVGASKTTIIYAHRTRAAGGLSAAFTWAMGQTSERCPTQPGRHKIEPSVRPSSTPDVKPPEGMRPWLALRTRALLRIKR